jgi:hypothetical protein
LAHGLSTRLAFLTNVAQKSSRSSNTKTELGGHCERVGMRNMAKASMQRQILVIVPTGHDDVVVGQLDLNRISLVLVQLARSESAN